MSVNENERLLLKRATARLRASVMATTFGIVGGTGLFVATVWLLLRGGPNVGEHLNLLGVYFPGYRVSWPGAFAGFGYGGITGAFLGGCTAWIYNRIADR